MNLLPPSQEKALVNQRDRVRQLERKAGKDARLTTEEVAVFSVVGDMAVSTSGSYRLRKGGQLVAVNFDSDGGATGDTEFDVLVNGAAVGSTVNVDVAVSDLTSYIGDVRAAAGSKVAIDLTMAGMHEKAVIELVFKG